MRKIIGTRKVIGVPTQTKSYEERVDDMLHELEQSHLRSIRRKGAVHVDVGVHFCPICKDALKKYIMSIIEEVY